jgi:hypothetical protein
MFSIGRCAKHVRDSRWVVGKHEKKRLPTRLMLVMVCHLADPERAVHPFVLPG